MRNKLTKITLAAGFALALAFTFGCSDDKDDGNPSGTSSHSVGSSVIPGTPITYWGETYETVVIGSQTWMARNLNYYVEGSVCYGEDKFGVSADSVAKNCATYGRLYDWATAMALPESCNTSYCSSQIREKHQGICPTGWHIPNDDDWDALFDYAGGEDIAGTKLKATSGWDIFSDNGTDDYGFSALPGGYCDIYDRYSFKEVGRSAWWWSNGGGTNNSISFGIDVYAGGIWSRKKDLLSIRCIKDTTGNSSSSWGSSSSSSRLSSSSSGGGSSSSSSSGGSNSSSSKQTGVIQGTPVTYEDETYETVIIGNQTWMARNLNYAVEGSRCYGESGYVYNAETKNHITLSLTEIQANCDKYGRLYDWATAMALPSKCNHVLSTSDADCAIRTPHRGICPSGWHISNSHDMSKLLWSIVDVVGGGVRLGTSLKATSGWESHEGESSNGTDDFGFAALPGGFRSYNGIFLDVGNYGNWWLASDIERRDAGDASFAEFWEIYGDGMIITQDFSGKTVLFSIRCLKD